MAGYGLYFYCLELITDKININNLTFAIEDDAEIIADNTKMHQGDVEIIMRYMVELNLFEANDGVITCWKLAKRLNQSMTSNTEFRKKIKEVNHDAVMTVSDFVMQEEEQEEEKKRIEQNKKEASKKSKDGILITTDLEKKVVDYRKSIKKPLKTNAGVNGVIKNLNLTATAWDVSIDTVFDYMAEKEWQSINKDYTNPFANKQAPQQAGGSSIPRNIKILNPGALL